MKRLIRRSYYGSNLDYLNLQSTIDLLTNLFGSSTVPVPLYQPLNLELMQINLEQNYPMTWVMPNLYDSYQDNYLNELLDNILPTSFYTKTLAVTPTITTSTPTIPVVSQTVTPQVTTQQVSTPQIVATTPEISTISETKTDTKKLDDSKKTTVSSKGRKEYPDIHPNCRDIGGVGPIKYGLIYRGGRFSKNLNKLKELGVDAEISVTKKTVLDVPNKMLIEWDGASAKQRGELLSQCMKWVIEGHKVYIHCDRGVDRTGHMIAILEGLLGASRDEISNDFKLSDTKGEGFHIKHLETGMGYANRYGGKNTSGDQFLKNFIDSVVKKYGVDRNLILKFIKVASNKVLSAKRGSVLVFNPKATSSLFFKLY